MQRAKKALLTLVVLLLMTGLISAVGCTRATPSPGYPYPSGGVTGPGGMMGPGALQQWWNENKHG